jgi:hypothetical protein
MSWRNALNSAVGVVMLSGGIVWGMFSLRQGFPVFFTLTETRLIGDLTVVTFGFFIVLPAAILAFWRPAISAALLAVGFFLADIAMLVDYGPRDTWVLGGQMAPNLALALGYAYLAFYRSRSPRLEG